MRFGHLKPRSVLSWTLVCACMSASLQGCGSGGDPRTLGGVIRGLEARESVALSVNGTSQTFSARDFSFEIPFVFSKPFVSGQTYNVSVVKHPVGQVCAVLRSASGRVEESISDVLVECHTSRLNDTGIGEGTPDRITALAPDSVSGRDAVAARLSKVGAGELGFDFTRICPAGEVADSTNGCPEGADWACVHDNVTELIWRRTDVPYTGTLPDPSEFLCGRADWRAPTVHELLSIVHAGKAEAPYVDEAFFEVTSAPAYSAEMYADGDGQRWAMDFGNVGVAGKYTEASNAEQRRVRWVSGTSRLNDPESESYEREEFPYHIVVIDARRELMWLLPKESVLSHWDDAVQSVASVNAVSPGGYADWRLPNRSELDSLVNRKLDNPAMDPAVAAEITQSLGLSVVFWTSSIHVGNPSSAWVVDFTYGDISPKQKSEEARVVYVRNRAFSGTP